MHVAYHKIAHCRILLHVKVASLVHRYLHGDEPLDRTCDGHSGANSFAHCYSFFGR